MCKARNMNRISNNPEFGEDISEDDYPAFKDVYNLAQDCGYLSCTKFPNQYDIYFVGEQSEGIVFSPIQVVKNRESGELAPILFGNWRKVKQCIANALLNGDGINVGGKTLTLNDSCTAVFALKCASEGISA